MERLAERYGLQVIWRYFPLHPEIPGEGMTLGKYFGEQAPRFRQAQRALAAEFQAEGLDYDAKGDFVSNTKKAQLLALWAREQGAGDLRDLHRRLYRAALVESANLSDEGLLQEIAEAAGFAPLPGESPWNSRSVEEALRREWALAKHRGVRSIPFFLMGKQGMIGAQPFERLCAFIEHAKTHTDPC